MIKSRKATFGKIRNDKSTTKSQVGGTPSVRSFVPWSLKVLPVRSPQVNIVTSWDRVLPVLECTDVRKCFYRPDEVDRNPGTQGSFKA
ncbi:hypothetical protein WAI453_000355 [Rhynchosporium graminicola]